MASRSGRSHDKAPKGALRKRSSCSAPCDSQSGTARLPPHLGDALGSIVVLSPLRSSHHWKARGWDSYLHAKAVALDGGTGTPLRSVARQGPQGGHSASGVRAPLPATQCQSSERKPRLTQSIRGPSPAPTINPKPGVQAPSLRPSRRSRLTAKLSLLASSKRRSLDTLEVRVLNSPPPGRLTSPNGAGNAIGPIHTSVGLRPDTFWDGPTASPPKRYAKRATQTSQKVSIVSVPFGTTEEGRWTRSTNTNRTTTSPRSALSGT